MRWGILALFCSVVPLFGRMIPHYRMDSYAYQSTDVVLCEELKIVPVNQSTPRLARQDVVCRVLKVYKGNLKVGQTISAKYSSTFHRRSVEQLREGVEKDFPKGRAVLFLNNSSVVTAKLIHKDEVYQFVQGDNPGPLILFRQKPERRKLKKGEKLTVSRFLKEVELSVKLSGSLAGVKTGESDVYFWKGGWESLMAE